MIFRVNKFQAYGLGQRTLETNLFARISFDISQYIGNILIQYYYTRSYNIKIYIYIFENLKKKKDSFYGE